MQAGQAFGGNIISRAELLPLDYTYIDKPYAFDLCWGIP